jgi:hypothetical protein
MAKKLKDVNNDGKVNFKDTWLGEKLLGGGKTKGPNLKESMAGARRESSAAPMKSPVPKAKPAAKAPAKATTPTKTSDRRSGASEPVSAVSGASRSTAGKVDKAEVARKNTPVRLGGTPATGPVAKKPNDPKIPFNRSPTPDRTATGAYDKYSAARMGNLTKAEYDAMSVQERAKKGLPMSWTDRMRSGGSFKAEAPTIAGKGRSRNTGKGVGMAKGGMTKKGKC